MTAAACCPGQTDGAQHLVPLQVDDEPALREHRDAPAVERGAHAVEQPRPPPGHADDRDAGGPAGVQGRTGARADLGGGVEQRAVEVGGDELGPPRPDVAELDHLVVAGEDAVRPHRPRHRRRHGTGTGAISDIPGVSTSCAAEPRAQGGGHVHRAVGALVHLEQAGDGAGDRAQGAVERGRGLRLPVGVAVADGQPPGLEGGAVRGAGQLPVGALAGEPRLDVELARGAGAEVAGGDVDDAVGQLERLEELLLPGEQPAVLVGGLLGPAEAEHLDLVEPVHADDAAGVLAVGAGLAAEAGRPAGVAARPGGEVEHLLHVHPGDRHLRGPDQVEVVSLDPVDLLVVLAR